MHVGGQEKFIVGQTYGNILNDKITSFTAESHLQLMYSFTECVQHCICRNAYNTHVHAALNKSKCVRNSASLRVY